MKIPHNTFCVLPWVSIETSPIGTTRPCCLAEEEIKDADGNKYDLNSSTLNKIHHSDYMNRLTRLFRWQEATNL